MPQGWHGCMSALEAVRALFSELILIATFRRRLLGN
jgi:hypothetical protein